MNKKQTSLRLSIGATSIFMIFVILVMCVLAVLSYLRANSYYESTLRQIDITTAYYKTESTLLEKFYNIDNQDDFKKYNVISKQGIYLLEEDVNDNQKIQLSFKQNNGRYQIIGIKTINKEE